MLLMVQRVEKSKFGLQYSEKAFLRHEIGFQANEYRRKLLLNIYSNRTLVSTVALCLTAALIHGPAFDADRVLGKDGFGALL